MEYEKIPYEHYTEAADYIANATSVRAKIAIVCGSGLGTLGDTVKAQTKIAYEDIPHFPTSTVEGHSGAMVIGTLANVPVICLQGRFHFYEGYTMQQCTIYVRVLKLLGVQYLLLTNASGGINQDYKVGDVMLIKDHINLMGFSGVNPLMGPNDERWGPRFPAVNNCYDRDLNAKSKDILAVMNFPGAVHEGVYCVVSGPFYQTTAEVIFLHTCGVDAVGMSTVPEVIIAKHCGMNVMALSLVTEACSMDYSNQKETSHDEVIAVANQRTEELQTWVEKLVEHLGQQTGKKLKPGACQCK